MLRNSRRRSLSNCRQVRRTALDLAGPISAAEAMRLYRRTVAHSPKRAAMFPDLRARMRAADAASVRDVELAVALERLRAAEAASVENVEL